MVARRATLVCEGAASVGGDTSWETASLIGSASEAAARLPTFRESPPSRENEDVDAACRLVSEAAEQHLHCRTAGFRGDREALCFRGAASGETAWRELPPGPLGTL